jgi:DNA-binding GntR family transcriptional regulator
MELSVPASDDSAPAPVVGSVTLDRPSTSDAVARELTRQILDGSIPAGTRLPEVELAEAFNVSRQSLRAGLAQLVHEGLLRRSPHRGVWVPNLTADELDDVYRVRAVFEVEAARFVTENPDRLGPLDEALGLMRAVPHDAGWGTTMEAHLGFHLALVDAAGSPRLSRAYRQIWSEAWLGLVASRENAELATPRRQAQQHADLLDVFRTGDPDRSARAVRDHMRPGLDAALEEQRNVHEQPSSQPRA